MRFQLSIAPSSGDRAGGYTFFSLPLPRGRFSGAIEARDPEDSSIAVELWPLASWPDGSVRMAQGLIKRRAGQVVLEVVSAATPLDHKAESASSFAFGKHQLDWCESSKMYRLAYEGMQYFDPGQFSQIFTTATGERVACYVEGAVKVVARHQHWLRLEAQFKGQSRDGSTGLRFRILWDLFADVPGCVLAVMAIHDRPGAVTLTLKSIQTELGLAESSGPVLHGVHQKRYGFEYTENRCVETPAALDLRVEGDVFAPQIANFESLGDTLDYPPYLNPPPREVSPFFWLKDGERRVVMEMENFNFLRPKGVLLEEGKACVGIWPEWAGPVIWQQGRRRQIRLAIGVEPSGPPADPARLQAATAALLETHRAQSAPDTYRQAGFFDMPWLPPCRPDKNPRIEGWASQVSVLKTPPEFFNFGDTPDSHYTRTYYPLGRVGLKKGAVDVPPGLAVISGRNAVAAGAMDARDPVYVNNEYDVLHCLASEYLRSGNAVLFRQLGWFARHTIEVDFLCYSDFESLHRAQGAHSVGHTSGGAYPSHFWTQGLVQYFFLTGDTDALEVIRALAEKTIWYFDHPRLGKLGSGINREMGWAVLTLVSAYEATMETRFLHRARQLIDSVMIEPLPEDLPVFSFGHTSLLLGCKAYLEAMEHSGETLPVRDWYLRVVRLAVHSAWHLPGADENAEARSKLSYDYERMDQGPAAGQRPRSGILSGYAALACLSYAWRLTGDRSFLESGLRSARAFFDETPGYFSSFRNPLPEGKPFAWLYRTMMEFFQALDECDLLREFELK